MAAYYLLLSFTIFLIVDYKYIYSLLDSTFFYSSSGSKLNYESNNKIKKNSLSIEQYDLIDIAILSLVIIILFLILFCVSLIPFNSTPLILNIGVKSIDLLNVMSEHIYTFKNIYYISISK